MLSYELCTLRVQRLLFILAALRDCKTAQSRWALAAAHGRVPEATTEPGTEPKIHKPPRSHKNPNSDTTSVRPFRAICFYICRLSEPRSAPCMQTVSPRPHPAHRASGNNGNRGGPREPTGNEPSRTCAPRVCGSQNGRRGHFSPLLVLCFSQWESIGCQIPKLYWGGLLRETATWAGNRPSPERPGTAFPRRGSPNPATPRRGCKVFH